MTRIEDAFFVRTPIFSLISTRRFGCCYCPALPYTLDVDVIDQYWHYSLYPLLDLPEFSFLPLEKFLFIIVIIMEVREPIYTFEIARRSVGRAALHLGIDSMSEGAMDVLADILLNYLNRVGRTLSHLVESSGRTSAHVNILDALQACELVASPAVERLHIRDSSSDDDLLFGTAAGGAGGAASMARAHLSSDWQGLAAFLFGPKWLQETEDEDEASSLSLTARGQQGNNNNMNGGGGGAAGGKVGPSATGEDTAKTKKKVGWDAPYLDEVLPFPQASEKCANPHPLPPYVGLSLHRADQDEEHYKADEVDSDEEESLDHIPDKVFTGSWGSISKRKADSLDEINSSTEDVTMTDADDNTASKPPPKKKVKISTSDSAAVAAATAAAVEEDAAQKTEDDKREEMKSKLHVPSFYPAPPIMKVATAKKGRTIVDTPTVPRVLEREEQEGSRSVRSSLVQLGSYWGSGWDDPSNSKLSDKASLAVPLGRSDVGEQAPSSALVVPLGRASGSRVSRILEGSMDAAAMQ